MMGFLSTSPLFAQERVNQRDINNYKQGHWIYFGKDLPETGIPDSGKVREGNFINDKREGPWTFYHNDGKTIRVIGNYENNRPKGNYTKYWSNGQLKKAGTFSKNMQLDSLKRFYSNGKLDREAWFNENGKEEGIVNYYYENGKLELSYKAKNGVPIDTGYRYWNNGDLKQQIVYDYEGRIKKSKEFEAIHPLDSMPKKELENDKRPNLLEKPGYLNKEKLPVGYHKIFNEAGEIWLDGVFENGIMLYGKEYIYDENGVLLKVKVYKNASPK